MMTNQEPMQIDPQVYVETLEEELTRAHGENLQLRAMVRHLSNRVAELQSVPVTQGGENPAADERGE